jgi:hypothetical protein
MKKIVPLLFVAFLFIQFFQIEENNPSPTPTKDFIASKNVPESTAKLLRTSCYDCHSNESKYPWYAKVQPVGWFLKHHIDEGREELNFSTFGTYEPKRQAHKLYEAAEVLENGEMPMKSYTLMHSEANLSPEQKKHLIKFFQLAERDIRLTHNLAPEEKK